MFPQTHAGRFATVVSIFGMPLIMALVTANVTRRMNLSGEEMRLMLSIEHNKYKMKVFSCAAKMIQRWWRSREGVGADVAMQTMLLVGEFYKVWRCSAGSAGGTRGEEWKRGGSEYKQ
eukprot:768245-Hanusia_phi.AAC.2